MKKVFFAIASLSVLIIALSFAYYLVIFIPNKEKVLGEQKVELTPYSTPFPTSTLIPTDTPTPKPTIKSVPTGTPIPLPSVNQGSELTPNQKATLDGINKAIEEIKIKMAVQEEIINREAKDYCSGLNLPYSDYKACETERFAKHKRATEEYLRLQELNKELALEGLKILGQR